MALSEDQLLIILIVVTLAPIIGALCFLWVIDWCLPQPRPPQPPQLLPTTTTHVPPAQPPPSRPRQLLSTATTPVLPAQPPPSPPRQLLPTATTPGLPAQPPPSPPRQLLPTETTPVLPAQLRPLLPTTTTHVLQKPVPLPREPTAQSICFSYGLITAAKCCVICLDEFVEQDKCEMLTKCNHMYHHRCIKRWQATGTYCPLCRFKQEKEVSSSGGRRFGLRPEKQTGWVMKAPEFPTVGLVRSREEMDKNERPVLEGDTMEIDGGGGGVEAPTAKRQRRSDSADLMDIPIKEVFYIKEALMAPSKIKEIDSMNDSGEDSTAKSVPVLVGKMIRIQKPQKISKSQRQGKVGNGDSVIKLGPKALLGSGQGRRNRADLSP
ncbi:hypothetical protein ACLB2K_020810 [Fragaria x ananassa]